jgi:steroid delta-isomerase-like uncharacterized protein
MSTEDNKVLVRQFYEKAWNQKDLAFVDENSASDYVDHTPGTPPGLPPGREGLKVLMSAYFTTFPDMHITVEDLIADGDKVVARWTCTGTFKEEMMGMAPTGKSATFTGISIDRIVNGKVVEGWTNFDMLGMLQQIGIAPSAG